MANAYDSIKIWIPPGVIILAPVFCLLMVALAFTQSGPTKAGAQRPVRIDASPTSPLADTLGDFKRFQDPSFYVRENTALITDLKTKLEALDLLLTDGTPYKTMNGEQVTKSKQVIKEMIAQINGILAATAANKAQDGQKQVTGLIANWNKLNRISLPGAAAVADKAAELARANNNGGGIIKYKRTRPIVTGANGLPIFLDCSGFVSYVLQITGVFRPNETSTVSGFYNEYIDDSRFELVASSPGGRIPDNEVRDVLQKGDIILTSSGTIEESYDTDNVNHAVIYIGPGYAEGDIAQSTNSGGKNGPQFSTLEDRLRKSAGKSPIQAILRPRP